MGDLSPYDLHRLMRTWLLAEDPYGMGAQSGSTPQHRIEPTIDTQPRSGRARGAGESAVANALAPPPPDPRARPAGEAAVQRELAPSPYGEADPRNAAYPDRAATQGEAAVDRALAPSPTAEVDRTRGQAWGEAAVDKALNPPLGSGGGFWAPGEAADTASAVGEQAVGGALAKKARSKVARGRLKDPQDPDARQPE
jgi:hypothetical protein